MGKVKKRILAAIIGIVASLSMAEMIFAENIEAEERTIEEAAEELQETIESVYLNLPEVYVYGNFPNRDEQNIEGYLGQEHLEFVGNQPFGNTGEGIYYYVLLDISGSIQQESFSEIKAEILGFQKILRENDRLILYSFGEEVTPLCNGTQTDEELGNLLEELENNDQKTLLFEAMVQAGEQAAIVSAEECRKRVIVVFSDGEDIAIGKKMSQEALKTLQERGIPVYAMCIEATNRENINSFGEFARMTGGDLTLLKEGKITGVLSALENRLLNMSQMEFRTETNQVSNEMETIVLRALDSDKVTSKEVMNSRWIPDLTPPELVYAAQTGDRQIELRFSEPVIGLENPLNFTITIEEKAVGIGGISVGGENSDHVVLTLTEDLKQGDYEISCRNITDCSMEKNSVRNTGNLYIEKALEKSEQKSFSDYRVLLFLLLVTVILLVIIILIRTGKRKTDKKNGSNKQKDMLNVKEDLILNIEIWAEGETPVNLRNSMKTSLIAGRRNTCDIVLNNPKVSKEHFLLEREGDIVWLTDLNSTNGTKINQIKLEPNAKVKLNKGDIIKAGDLEIKLEW